MELMKGVIMSACFVSIAMSVTGVLKPGDKFNNQIKIIFVLVFILTVVTPLVDNIRNFSFIKSKECFESTDEYKDMNQYIDSSIEESVKSTLEETIKTKLSERGIICPYAEVNISMDKNYQVTIEDVIIDNSVYYESKSIIAEILSVDENIIKGN